MSTVRSQKSIVSFTDLNNDCLEYIFNFLNLNDLINIADTRVSFSSPATYAFRNKYGDRWTQEIDNVNHIRLLLHFGNYLTELSISGRGSSRNGINIDDINNYAHHIILQKKIPFQNIARLEFCGSFGSNIEINHFPNIRSLHFIDVSLDNPRIVERHFPLLEYLSVKNSGKTTTNRSTYFTNENIRASMSLNSQLNNISLTNDRVGINLCTDMLRFIGQNGTRLQNLEIDLQHSPSYLFQHEERIVFTHVTNFTLNVSNDLLLDLLPKIIFPQLTKLKLTISSHVTSYSIDFITQYHNLKNLEIIFEPSVKSYSIEYYRLNEVMKLPDIENLKIQFPFLVHATRIMQLISSSESLLEIHLIFVQSEILTEVHDEVIILSQKVVMRSSSIEDFLNILNGSDLNRRWRWSSSIKYVKGNNKKQVDSTELNFYRK